MLTSRMCKSFTLAMTPNSIKNAARSHPHDFIHLGVHSQTCNSFPPSASCCLDMFGFIVASTFNRMFLFFWDKMSPKVTWLPPR